MRQRHPLHEGGLTLIELLVTFVAIAILIAIAVPAYLTFTDRSNHAVAKVNIRIAVPAIEGYRIDNDGYDGMTFAALDEYSNEQLEIAIVGAPSATSYCIRNTEPADPTYYKQGPSGEITTIPCAGP